jgi:FkbM family methyltransferase
VLLERAAATTAERAPRAGTTVGERASSSLNAPVGDDSIGVPEEARKKVRLGYSGSTAQVLATPETRPTRRKGVLELDAATVAWLDEHVHPGDVVYDIGAGVGPYALVVALHRGGVSVAFEPGFASFKRLCDNLLLNACSRSVIPLPIALGDRAGLLELEYVGEAGGRGHTLTPREWRPGRDAIEEHYTQPVCAERLDDVVARYRLPHPHVMRVAVRRGAAAVLRGAEARLRDARLRSVLASVKGDREAEEVAEAMRPLGFAVASASGSDRNRTVVLVRTGDVEGTSRPPGLLRRVAGRIRL